MMSTGAARRVLLPFNPDRQELNEGGDRGSEVATVHSGRDGERPVPLRKSKESGRRENCEKDFVSR